jgi:hypothetical protein
MQGRQLLIAVECPEHRTNGGRLHSSVLMASKRTFRGFVPHRLIIAHYRRSITFAAAARRVHAQVKKRDCECNDHQRKTPARSLTGFCLPSWRGLYNSSPWPRAPIDSAILGESVSGWVDNADWQFAGRHKRQAPAGGAVSDYHEVGERPRIANDRELDTRDCDVVWHKRTVNTHIVYSSLRFA